MILSPYNIGSCVTPWLSSGNVREGLCPVSRVPNNKIGLHSGRAVQGRNNGLKVPSVPPVGEVTGHCNLELDLQCGFDWLLCAMTCCGSGD